MFSFGRTDIREGIHLGCLLAEVGAGTISILEECVAECNHKYPTTKLQFRLPSRLPPSTEVQCHRPILIVMPQMNLVHITKVHTKNINTGKA
jgi:hypothetical protein